MKTRNDERTHPLRTGVLSLVTAISLFALPNCGLYGGGGGGPTVDVDGNLDAVLPGDTGGDIVVFVYTLKHEQEDCADPQLPDNQSQAKQQTLSDGETTFEVRNAQAGRIVVAFLLDNPGGDADGRIDPGDPVAILNDPDCVLDDVPNKYIVQANDVRINFTSNDQAGFPAPGRAEASPLTEGPE